MFGRILCVDDNQRNLRILQELLGDEYDLELAECGEDALDCVANQPPQLILLDVMMPGISGFDVCEKLRAEDATREIPIVLVTAKAQEDEKQHGFEVGANAYLVKPFDPDVLLDLVENFVPCTKED